MLARRTAAVTMQTLSVVFQIIVIDMYSLPLGCTFFERGWLSSNNVLLQDDSQAILVDSGYWTHSEQTFALVSSALNNSQLTTLINTHLHSDHCGGNAFLQKKYPDLKTLIPSGNQSSVDAWNPAELSYTATGQHCPKFSSTQSLQDGDVFVVASKSWRIHAAPGHDPHSLIIFNEDDGVLISADALWENGFGVVFPEIEGKTAFDDVEWTLKLIKKLNPKLVLPGHGAAFSDVTNALIRANNRLAQFRNTPDKHAIYAAKVLLKFKLLELQSLNFEKFLVWAKSVLYLNLLHAEYAKHMNIETWILGLCQSLERSGACTFEGEKILNS